MDTSKIADALIQDAQSSSRVTNRMSRLSEILDQMTVVLNDLKTVMDAEQHHLSSGQINGSALQRITEDKSSLLATLDYLEKQRRAEQDAETQRQ